MFSPFSLNPFSHRMTREFDLQKQNMHNRLKYTRTKVLIKTICIVFIN